MQHVTGLGNRHHPSVRNVREPAPHHGKAVGGAFPFGMVVEPARDVRVRSRDPQRRRRDVAPDRVGFLDPVHRRVRQPVPGIGGEANRSVRQRLGPMRRQKDGLVAGQSRIALLQPVRDRVEACIGGEIARRRERVEPFRHLVRRGGRLLGAHAESVERDHAARARRAHAGVVQHDVAAETVPGEIHRFARGRTPAPAPPGRRCSRRTSSLAAARRISRSRADPARSRTSRGRTHRPETGTTPPRPSSRGAERASGRRARPTSTRANRDRAARCGASGRASNVARRLPHARHSGTVSGSGLVISCGKARGRPSSRSDSCRRRRSASHLSVRGPSPSRNRRRSLGDRTTGIPTG